MRQYKKLLFIVESPEGEIWDRTFRGYVFGSKFHKLTVRGVGEQDILWNKRDRRKGIWEVEHAEPDYTDSPPSISSWPKIRRYAHKACDAPKANSESFRERAYRARA
jgi:hypothetical protein